MLFVTTKPDYRVAENPRRGEVSRWLNRCGLTRRIDEFSAHTRTTPEGWSGTAGWLRAAASLGPAFSAFGLYLGSRPDLLGWRLCQQLATLPDRGPAVPESKVADLLASLDGLATVDLQPSRVFLDRQLHAARSVGGRLAEVHLVPPGLVQRFGQDGEHLDVWRRLFAAELRPAFDRALADFRLDFGRSLDLDQELRRSGATFRAEAPGIAFPRLLHRQQQLAVFEDLGATSLSILLAQQRGEPRGGLDLIRCWLNLALSGFGFPERPNLDRAARLADGRWTFGPCPWRVLPEAARRDFERYLEALQAADASMAFEALQGRLESVTGEADLEGLWQRFRQVAPQRDGGWDLTGQRLADRVILHGQLLSELGFSLEPESLAFFRGLMQLEAAARLIAPQRDLLAEGVAERKWLATARRWRRMAAPQDLIDGFRQSWSRGLELPSKLQSVLRQAKDGNLSMAVNYRESPSERRLQDRQTLVGALAIAFLAVALLSSKWVATAESTVAITLTLLALGGALLWLASSRAAPRQPTAEQGPLTFRPGGSK